jgi:hypothetical protein
VFIIDSVSFYAALVAVFLKVSSRESARIGNEASCMLITVVLVFVSDVPAAIDMYFGFHSAMKTDFVPRTVINDYVNNGEVKKTFRCGDI